MIIGMKLRVWWSPLLLSLVLTLLFVGLATIIHTWHDFSVDHTILEWINGHGSTALDKLFKGLTILGEPTLVTGFAAILAVALYRKGHADRAALALAAIFGSAAIMIILKHAFHRVRPDIWQPLVHESSFSFPSAHAMASLTLALTLAYTLRGYRHYKTIVIILVGYTLLIGFSRLYLGVHYPSDILGGWLAAAIWTLFLISLHSVSKRYTV
jgi:undecaprenyl-diphosphatase